MKPATTEAGIASAGQRVVETGAFLLPLVFWPGVTQAFSTPKLWLLAAVAAVIVGVAFKAAPHGREWLFFVWPLAVAISTIAGSFVSFRALAAAVLPVAICWAAMRLRLHPKRIARTILYASAAESMIVVLQYCGADPMAVLGWRPEGFASPRMRAYGTLGNPNYVAAWLCATLPLFAGVFAHEEKSTGRAAFGWSSAFALQLAAIAATGSRVFLLAAPAAAAILLWRTGKTAKWWVAAVPVAAMLVWLSPARPLGATVEGRVYLTRVSLSRWADIPLTGYGPGAFAPRFAEWQVQWLRNRGPEEPARVFAGEADHAHNDYAEFLVEYGLIGLGAFVAASAWLLLQATRRRADASPWSAAALAGVAALLAAALVDFPFHRPAEWALYWILLAASAPGREQQP